MNYIELKKCSKIKYIKSNTKIYTSRVNNEQVMYSFINEISANNCKQFLKVYKDIHGKYPDNNNSSVQFSNEIITIEEETIGSLQNTCLLLNIGLLGITDFNYSFNRGLVNVDFKAANLITEDLEELKQSEQFNYVKNFYMISKLI
jgi:hypothetical protein